VGLQQRELARLLFIRRRRLSTSGSIPIARKLILTTSSTSAGLMGRLKPAPGSSSRKRRRIVSASGAGARKLGNDWRFFFLRTRFLFRELPFQLFIRIQLTLELLVTLQQFRKLTLLIRIQFPFQLGVWIQLTLEFELLVTLQQFRKFPFLKLSFKQ